MFCLVLALVATATFQLSSAGSGAHWGYDEHHGDGPSKWSESYPKCGGNKQSPINVVMKSTEYNKSLNAFQFTGYETFAGYAYEITNNGHTAQLTIKTGEMTIAQGGLPNAFKLAQFHFHWGRDNKVGSEHTINGKSFPLEMHLVHFNTIYNNVSLAVENEDGLAVLGVFAEVGETSNPTFQKFLDRFDAIQNKDDKITIDVFALNGLLPTNRLKYVRYQGSLTTPPCSEIVTWTVFKEPIKISQTQLNKFRTLNHNAAGVQVEPLVDNFRPVLELNHRKVTRSYQELEPTDTSTAGISLHLLNRTPAVFVALTTIVCTLICRY